MTTIQTTPKRARARDSSPSARRQISGDRFHGRCSRLFFNAVDLARPVQHQKQRGPVQHLWVLVQPAASIYFKTSAISLPAIMASSSSG